MLWECITKRKGSTRQTTICNAAAIHKEKRAANIRHFRSLASLTSGQLQKLDRQSRVRESVLHNWLQLAGGNMFLIKVKLGLDNSMAYCHPEFIWQHYTK